MLKIDDQKSKTQKKKLLITTLTMAVAMVSLVSFGVITAKALKPTDNQAGAQKVSWNLSGDVMPVPPYGSADIIGSDTASKLIVNRPQGNNKLAITGSMKGLNPNTTYTVYLSKKYDKFIQANVEGTWVWSVLGTYNHTIVIDNQDSDGNFEGRGCYPATAPLSECGEGYPGTTTEIITGHISGVNQITLTTVYKGPYNAGYTVTATGTIHSDGSMSGTSPWGWNVGAGSVTTASGSTGWPGLLSQELSTFTFTTDEYGDGSWHVNFKAADLADITQNEMSVWINGGGRTILISDVFNIEE